MAKGSIYDGRITPDAGYVAPQMRKFSPMERSVLTFAGIFMVIVGTLVAIICILRSRRVPKESLARGTEQH